MIADVDKKFVILDMKGIICAGYHATAKVDPSSGGVNMYREVIDRVYHAYDKAVIYGAWEFGPPWRASIYKEYKAHREPKPEHLLIQLEKCLRLTVDGYRRIRLAWAMGHEADDVMATMASKVFKIGGELVIVTRDKDLLQLAGDGITIDRMGAGLWDAHRVRTEWGVDPWLLKDVFALMGDSVDGIPGVKGIGEGTATRLVSAIGDIDSIYQNKELVISVHGARIWNLLVQGEESARLSLKLATLLTDLDLRNDDPTLS